MESNITGKQRSEGEANIFNIRWILTTIIGAWPWFVASVAVAYIIASVYLRYSTPVYKLSTEILINDSKAGRNDELLLDGLGISAKNNDINNVVRIIKSKQLMEKVIDRLDLNLQYFEYGNVKATQFYGDKPFIVNIDDSVLKNITTTHEYNLTFTSANDFVISKNKSTWKGSLDKFVNLDIGSIMVQKTPSLPIKEDAKYAFMIREPKSMAAGMAGGVDVVRPDKTANYINITVTDEISDRGRNVLDTLVRVYAESSVDDKNRIANNTIDFIDGRLEVVGEELKGIEKETETYQKSNYLTGALDDQSKMLLASSSDYQKQITEKEVQLNIIGALETHLNAGRPVPSGLLVDDGSLKDIISKYNDLQGQREQLLISNTENNPQVKNVDKLLTKMKQDMQLSIQATKKSIGLTIAELRKLQGSIDANIRKVPEKTRIMLDYSRKQNIKEELYLYLLKKREETAVAKAATVSNVTVVNTAENAGIVKPNKGRIKNTAILLGLIAPMLVLVLRRMLNTRIITKSDILSNSQIPVLGEIGHNENEVDIAVKNNSQSVLSEQFRSLRTNIQFLLPEKGDKVILFTSSMSGEGKSFIAVNLASTFAISGKKVVLMELDLRKPKISKQFGLDNKTGFSTYAVGQAEIEDIIKPSNVVDNLFIISSGPLPPNPSELIMLPRIDTLFAYLKENFDYVLIDTAPIGLVTDALLLNRFSDTTLYIVRQGYTFKQQIQIPNELQENNKIAKLSFVINDVMYKRGYSYGYGYGYESGYGYSYGYGYGKYQNGYFEENNAKNKGLKVITKRLKRFLPSKK